MKLKASVDYGVRAILYLAIKGDTCSSREISEEMAVPRDYLIQLALRLRNAGLIKARPGKNGGYVLARPASEIKIGDIHLKAGSVKACFRFTDIYNREYWTESLSK